MTLLRATHAALRCRSFIERGAWAESQLQLLLLQEALLVLSDFLVDPETFREVELLRAAEARLRCLVARDDGSGGEDSPVGS